MDLDSSREGLRRLDSLSRRFQEVLRGKLQGLRYERREERLEALDENVRRARHYLRRALDALEGKPLCEQLAPTKSPNPPSSSWLRERLQSLVGFLSGNLDVNAPPPDAPLGAGILAGDSGVLSLTELFSALHAEGQSGVLRIAHPEETIELHFWKGELVHAFSHHSPHGCRLGEILVAQGALSEGELASALAERVGSAHPLGELLARGGWIDRDQLEEALETQVRGVFQRMLSRRDARYAFEPGLPPTEGTRSIWNVSQLIAEGTREAG